jgi:iron complex transport system ATP-binding protein
VSTLLLKQVSFQYQGGFALQDIDLSLPEKSFLALIGPNGSGKTTLLQLMSGLLQAKSGQIRLQDRPLNTLRRRELARQIAVIASDQYFAFPFPVAEIVAMGRFPYLGRLQKLTDRDRQIVEEALQRTEIGHLKDRPISQLSSGERQRVLLARAIAQSPAILMLDEPNTHLDIHHQIEVFRLLQHLNQEHSMTVVVVLHDLTAASTFCRTVALLSEGKLVKTGTPQEVITTETIRSVYQADIEVHPSPTGGFPQISYGGKTLTG